MDVRRDWRLLLAAACFLATPFLGYRYLRALAARLEGDHFFPSAEEGNLSLALLGFFTVGMVVLLVAWLRPQQ
jgi:hypothetical protein